MLLESCIPDVWYWRWLLILLNFRRNLLFVTVDLLQNKSEGMGIKDGLFYRRYSLIVPYTVSVCPVKRGNRAGSSRNEFDYSRRRTQTSFPLLESRSCEKFVLAHFSILLLSPGYIVIRTKCGL